MGVAYPLQARTAGCLLVNQAPTGPVAFGLRIRIARSIAGEVFAKVIETRLLFAFAWQRLISAR